jgi:uncharacterized protein (TIGR00369 family)
MSPVPSGFTPTPLGGEFIRANGPLYLRLDGGSPALGFRIESRHTNGMNVCHGGMMASFCDMLLPLLTGHHAPELQNRFLPTISLQVDYLAPAPLGAWVEGTAEVLRVTTSMVFVQGRVAADGVPVARASGVFKISRRSRHAHAGHDVGAGAEPS